MTRTLSVLAVVLAGVVLAGVEASPAHAGGPCSRPDPPPSCEPAGGYVVAGTLAGAVRSPAGVTVSGTATEQSGAPLRVDITIGGTVVGSLTPDGSGRFAGEVRPRQGSGVCARTVVVGDTFGKPLGCVGLAVNSDPVGALDPLAVSGGQVVYSGWALDADAYTAADVIIKHDGIPTRLTANAARPGVGAAHPGYGDNHGFTGTLAARWGSHEHTVCAIAVNVAAGVNTELGCRTYITPVVAPTLERRGFTDTSVGLYWTDNSISEDGFRIEQQLGDGTWLWVGSAPANATHYWVTFLASDTVYNFRVVAFNSNSQAPSGEVWVRTMLRQPHVTDLRAVEIHEHSITLAWTDNADNELGYEIIVDGPDQHYRYPMPRGDGTGRMTVTIGGDSTPLSTYTVYEIRVVPYNPDYYPDPDRAPVLTVRTRHADPG